MAIENLISEFKGSLTGLSLSQIAESIIDPNNCVGLDLITANSIRENIANNFNIEIENVLIVGSAQLGFSISEKKDRDTGEILKERYRVFDDMSDIDVAIIDSNLFDSYWEDIFNIHCEDKPWSTSSNFQYYFFRGWIRPDKFPHNFPKGNDWWKFFNDLGREKRRKIHGGLYKSENFLMRYQEICIKECLTEIKLGA